MDGLKFYWVAWFFWIYITFFMKRKNQNRTKYGILLLIIIFTSSTTIQIWGFNFQLVGILSLVIGCVYITEYRLSEKLYLFICSLIVCLGYVSFQIYELFDPVWLFINRQWMLAAMLTCLVLFLQSQSTKRLLTLSIGTFYGEVIYALILQRFNFPYTVSSLYYLDSIALSFLFLVVWYSLEQSATIFDQLMQNVERRNMVK